MAKVPTFYVDSSFLYKALALLFIITSCCLLVVGMVAIASFMARELAIAYLSFGFILFVIGTALYFKYSVSDELTAGPGLQASGLESEGACLWGGVLGILLVFLACVCCMWLQVVRRIKIACRLWFANKRRNSVKDQQLYSNKDKVALLSILGELEREFGGERFINLANSIKAIAIPKGGASGISAGMRKYWAVVLPRLR